MNFSSVPSTKKSTDVPPTTTVEATAAIFARRGILLVSCQFLRTGPNTLCDRSHSCSLSDDLAKQARASRSKGVVGSTGRNIPRTASPTKSSPKAISMGLWMPDMGRDQSDPSCELNEQKGSARNRCGPCYSKTRIAAATDRSRQANTGRPAGLIFLLSSQIGVGLRTRRAAVIVSVAWIGIEGFHHYGKARLRHHLGLCDAMVCNRYLLWGFTGVGWAIYEAIYALQQIEFEVTGSYSAWMDAVASTLELIPIACIWLIFFPPTHTSAGSLAPTFIRPPPRTDGAIKQRKMKIAHAKVVDGARP
jgi:hypothetical protein